MTVELTNRGEKQTPVAPALSPTRDLHLIVS